MFRCLHLFSYQQEVEVSYHVGIGWEMVEVSTLLGLSLSPVWSYGFISKMILAAISTVSSCEFNIKQNFGLYPRKPTQSRKVRGTKSQKMPSCGVVISYHECLIYMPHCVPYRSESDHTTPGKHRMLRFYKQVIVYSNTTGSQFIF